MPKISKLAHFEFSVENFLNARSPDELKEVDLLNQSNRYRQRMKNKPLNKKNTQEERNEIEALGFDPEFFLGETTEN